jgi:hypothetical protein
MLYYRSQWLSLLLFSMLRKPWEDVQRLLAGVPQSLKWMKLIPDIS